MHKHFVFIARFFQLLGKLSNSLSLSVSSDVWQCFVKIVSHMFAGRVHARGMLNGSSSIGSGISKRSTTDPPRFAGILYTRIIIRAPQWPFSMTFPSAWTLRAAPLMHAADISELYTLGPVRTIAPIAATAMNLIIRGNRGCQGNL